MDSNQKPQTVFEFHPTVSEPSKTPSDYTLVDDLTVLFDVAFAFGTMLASYWILFTFF